MSAWEAARLLNAKQSPLHRLPTEILLQIMQNLHDPTSIYHSETEQDIYFFRHVCSRFAHLFADAFWDPMRDDSAVVKIFGPLPPFGLPILSEGKLPYRRRLRAHRLVQCAACTAYRADEADFAARIANLQQPLNCCGCKWQHPAIAFAPSQRTRRMTSRRTCIARTGRITICPHKSITSFDVYSWLNPHVEEGESSPPELEDRTDGTEHGWPMMQCKKCFKGFPEDERMRPTVWRDRDTSAIAYAIRWSLPLATVSPDETEVPKQAILSQLALLERDYKSLIGAQSSFVSERITRVIKSAQSDAMPRKLPLDLSDDRKLYLKKNERNVFYLECQTWMKFFDPVRCPRRLVDYTPFIPLLDPNSIELDRDTETMHVTWCPDSRCGTGKGWDAHLMTVKTWDECARDSVPLESQWYRNPGTRTWFGGTSTYLYIYGGKFPERPYVPYRGSVPGPHSAGQQSEARGSWFTGMIKSAFGK